MALKFKDPVSGLTHLAGAALGFFGALFLIQRSLELHTARYVLSYCVFGVSLVLLYLSSAFYHLIPLEKEKEILFKKLDHSMIYIFIAGSYTPYCLISLREKWGTGLLITVWTAALGGLLVKLFFIHAPRWLSTGLYLLLGWAAIVVIYPLSQALSPAGFVWLVTGGLCYTVGAVVYAVKWPDPFPNTFGFHEIWHIFVLAGSTSHFLSVATILYQ